MSLLEEGLVSKCLCSRRGWYKSVLVRGGVDIKVSLLEEGLVTRRVICIKVSLLEEELI